LVVDLPNWVGDHVMAMPAARRLLDANSDGETTLHTRRSLERLCRTFFPGVRVVASPPKSVPVVDAIRVCRSAGRFDLGVTFRHALRAKVLLRMAARYAVGSVGGGARLLTDRACRIDRSRHQVFDPAPMLGALGVPPPDPEWRPLLPESFFEEGRIELERTGIGETPVVGLAPAGVWGESKRWSTGSFGRLAARLGGAGIRSIFVVGPGEDDLAERAVAAAGLEIPVVGPRLDVAGLAATITRLDLVVGNDSGPAHLAAMVRVPSVTLFGPTDPERTAPMGSGHRVLRRELECAPCGEPICPLGHTACMNELGVDEVFEAVRSMIADRAGP
jgi:heptosyltransferase-2